jgi:hypothetical protein
MSLAARNMLVEESSVVLEDSFAITTSYGNVPESLAGLQMIVHVFLRVPLKAMVALGVLEHLSALQGPVFMVLCRTCYPNVAKTNIETWKLHLVHHVVTKYSLRVPHTPVLVPILTPLSVGNIQFTT